MNNRYFYAQLAVIEGVQTVIGKSDLSGEVTAGNMLPLASLSDCQLGDHYINGAFVTPPPPAEPVA